MRCRSRRRRCRVVGAWRFVGAVVVGHGREGTWAVQLPTESIVVHRRLDRASEAVLEGCWGDGRSHSPLGYRPEPRRPASPPARRPVRPRQRPLVGRLQDPGRPRHRRRLPLAVRPRRGADPRPDHRSCCGACGREGHRPTAHRRPVRQLHGRGHSRADRCAAAARRVGDGRRRRRRARAGRGARRAAAHRRRRWRRRVHRHRLQGLHPLPAAPEPVRASGCPTSRTTATSSTPRSWPAYPRHIAAMFALVYGEETPPGEWQATAERIVALETKLAAAHWDVVKRRDADLTYNLRTFADLPAEAPGFDWAGWVDGDGRHPGGGGRTRCAPTRLPDRIRGAVGQRGPRGLEALGPLAADPCARRSCSPTLSSPRTSTSTAARSAAPSRSGTGGSVASRWWRT